ncbi:MAG: DUF1552 domain-containing protein [Myxococcota bacterium]|nr:DUF1552 domain-containing protein [Myxococcota bacterium]
MKRRTFLKALGGLGGLSLASPLINSAMAQIETPRRFVFILEGNCIEPINLMTPGARALINASVLGDIGDARSFSKMYGHGQVLTAADPLSGAISLDPLAGGDDRLDLNQKSAVIFGLSSTVTGGGHNTNFGALSSTRATGARSGGPTIDAVLAAHPTVRQQTPFDAIRVGVHSLQSLMNTTTCAYSAANAAPLIIDPARAFTNLFGVVGDAQSQAAFNRKGLLLDYALADVNAALATFPGNRQERAKLEGYLESLEAVRLRQQRLGILGPMLASVPPAPSESELYGAEDPLLRLHAHFELIRAALIGQLTNVAVIGVGTGGGFNLPYPALNPDFPRHDIHHMSEIEPAQAIPIIQAATRDLVTKAAGLARSLAAVPEGDGTMLDHTLIVLMSENGERHHSEGIEWPTLLIGGQKMGFKTDGRTLVYPGHRHANNRQMSNLFNTIGHAAGMDLNHFGAEGASRIAPGPLSEIWRPS